MPVYALRRASILDFRPRLTNRCRVLPVYALRRASILDFKARLGNRCKVLPVYALRRASILDFRPRLGNRCKVFPISGLLRASILDFKPKLGNRCSVLAAALRNGPPTVVVAATRSVSDSILRCRKGERFRLQRSWRQRGPRQILFFVAERENGFACSRRSFASDSNFRCREEEWFRLQWP